MFSKGIQVYSYIAVANHTVEFSVPGKVLTKNALRQFSDDYVEVNNNNFEKFWEFSGTFAFRVLNNGQQIARESLDINTLSGDLEGGSMKTMENQISIVTPNVIVNYGFYDAGNGVAGLPSNDQCYVTVTPNYSNWMHDVATPGSPQAEKPFKKLFLPSAHDVGMNTMATASALVRSPALVDVMKSISPIFAEIAGMMTERIVRALAPNIIQSLAITQKDNVSTILNLGARYFEFRPAYLYDRIRKDTYVPDVLYYSHSVIPGMPYAQFLHECVEFLIAHPDEIIVTQLRWDGIPPECARPTDQELTDCLNTAFASANGSIITGDLNDMLTLSISSLRTQRKRLLIFKNADSFSTYTDAGNATLVPAPIVAEFESLASNPTQASGKPFTNLQCQATSSNIKAVVIQSALTANVDNSCLLATKAICDNKTLPWIVNNGGRLESDQLVVIMNDFFDGATADTAVEWSRKRLD